MRTIGWFVLSFALLIQNPGAEGQDSSRPKGPADLGKKADPKAIEIDEDAVSQAQVQRSGKLPGTPQPSGGLDGTIDRLIKDLEDLRSEMKKTKQAAKSPGGGPPGWQVVPGPMPGQPGFPPGPGSMPGRPGPAPGGSPVDQKLDMILKQMDEMRKDIKELQNRLPPAKEKKGPGFDFKGFFGPKGPMSKEKKPAPPEARDKEKADVAVQKALDYLQQRQREAQSKKNADNAILKQQIERLLDEVEKLRKQIDKAQPGK